MVSGERVLFEIMLADRQSLDTQTHRLQYFAPLLGAKKILSFTAVPDLDNVDVISLGIKYSFHNWSLTVH